MLLEIEHDKLSPNEMYMFLYKEKKRVSKSRNPGGYVRKREDWELMVYQWILDHNQHTAQETHWASL